MLVYRKIVLAFILLLSVAGTLFAAKGTVTHRTSGCSYYLVETSKGFALLEWYGGTDSDKGDLIVGDFETYGMKDIYNATKESEIRVWVEDFWMDKEDALEELFDHCD